MDNLMLDWEVAKHLKTWLTNLKRARDKRKKESVEALRQVIVSSRGLRIYIKEWTGGKRNYASERQLSGEWTKLSYLLKDLDLKDLANKCYELAVKLRKLDSINKKTVEKTREALADIEEKAKEILDEVEPDKT